LASEAGLVVRFVHTADWQIGRPFDNIPGDAGAALRDARFEAVRRIAGLATEARADAVLVAGDIFDGNLVSDATLRRLLAATEGFAGPWVLLPGNHDAGHAGCVWDRLERMGPPENILVPREPGVLGLAHGRLAVIAAPLVERRTFDDLTRFMDTAETPAGAVRVGLAHGSIAELLPEAADAPNPIAPDRAERARLDYLALGDWHGTLQVGPTTWYAGTPEPDRLRSKEAGNVLLVEIEAAGAPPKIRRVGVGRHVWQALELELSAADDPASLLERRLAEIPAPERTLLFLRLDGLVGLEARQRVAEVLAARGAVLRHLELDDAGLRAQPEEDEVTALRALAVVGEAAAALLERARAGGEEERATAELALRFLWQERARSGEGA
jgi:DNA repair exonuclease SbcCD nuclease subunit